MGIVFSGYVRLGQVSSG